MVAGSFEPFGTFSEVRLIIDRETGKSRGFGFVTIKTDKVDARILADLLRGRLVPSVHIAGGETRRLARGEGNRSVGALGIARLTAGELKLCVGIRTIPVAARTRTRYLPRHRGRSSKPPRRKPAAVSCER